MALSIVRGARLNAFDRLRLAPAGIPIALRRYATSSSQITDKSRILEKPTKFNPPSHGARRTRPRQYPGPSLTEHQRQEMDAKRYPNMMPPEGSFLHWFLTNRSIHLWITLTILFMCCIYTLAMSFVSATSLRHLLPSSNDFIWHPIKSMRQFVAVYRQHVQIESQKVAEKRRQKLEDVEKRKEFMRAHGVEPGFLTGGWMDKFGTVEGDAARRAVEEQATKDQGIDPQSPIANSTQGDGQPVPESQPPKRKPKYWLGIW